MAQTDTSEQTMRLMRTIAGRWEGHWRKSTSTMAAMTPQKRLQEALMSFIIKELEWMPADGDKPFQIGLILASVELAGTHTKAGLQSAYDSATKEFKQSQILGPMKLFAAGAAAWAVLVLGWNAIFDESMQYHMDQIMRVIIIPPIGAAALYAIWRWVKR